MNTAGHQIISSTTPTLVLEPALAAGWEWSDTSTNTIKVCTSISPVTFASVGGGTAGGADTQVQFNDGGTAFGGDTTFTFNKTTNVLQPGDAVDFTGGAAPATPSAGHGRQYAVTNQGHTQLAWIDEDGTILRTNRDNVLIVKNTSGSPMTKGQVVDVNASSGNVPTVRLTDADVLTHHAEGILAEDIAANAFGLMMLGGNVGTLDTSGYIEGDILYVSQTAGAFTTTAPSFPAFQQVVAVVIRSHATQGQIEVIIGVPRYPVALATDVTGDLPFANLTQGSALSVLGVTGNATADNASIAAASDKQVFRREGTAVAFGAVDLAAAAAVTGVLPLANFNVAAVVGRSLSRTLLTSGTAQTYTVPAGVHTIVVKMVAGGGGGGGVKSLTSESAAGGGGGGGGYCEKRIAVTPAGTFTYTVGAKGTGGTGTAPSNGNAGNDTTFTDGGSNVLTAKGGGAGPAQTAANSIRYTQGGAASAVATGGDINVGGQPGHAASCGATNEINGGGGGSSLYGAGGTHPTTDANGNNATGYGGGGSGARCSATTDRTGGDGTDGIIIIEEYS